MSCHATMHAAVFDEYGPASVVHVGSIEKPEPKAHEVLVQIVCTTVSAGDWRVRSLCVPRGFGLLVRLFFGFFKPRVKVLGGEAAGRVVAVGGKVTRFAVGDEVICSRGAQMGCHAQYLTMMETGPIVKKPAALTFEQAAAISFGGLTAYDFLVTKGRVKSGDRVLVIGASGTVGSAALQLAKYFGAEVTGVCGPTNKGLVKTLGADRVLDYTRDTIPEPGAQYDLIFDAVGEASLGELQSALAPGGRALLVVADFCSSLMAPFLGFRQDKKFISGTTSEKREYLQKVVQLAESGAWQPLIDSVLPLAEIEAAHLKVESRRKCGSVVITMPL